jgi:hypothetical protein
MIYFDNLPDDLLNYISKFIFNKPKCKIYINTNSYYNLKRSCKRFNTIFPNYNCKLRIFNKFTINLFSCKKKYCVKHSKIPINFLNKLGKISNEVYNNYHMNKIKTINHSIVFENVKEMNEFKNIIKKYKFKINCHNHITYNKKIHLRFLFI